MAAQKGVGLAPSSMVEGGGLLSDIDVTIKEASFVMWDYAGKKPIPVPAARFLMADGEGVDHEQYWSAGSGKFAPSPDGSRLVPLVGDAAINSGSNFALLIQSIVNAGFPENRLEDDITIFQGMKAHMERVAAPRRNIQKAPRADGKVYEDTVLIVTKIIKLPWEAAGKGGSKAKPTGKAAPAEPEEGGEDEMSGLAMTTVMGLLTEKGRMTKQQLLGAVFQALKEDPNRNAIVQVINQDEFLKGGPWTYAKGSLSME